VDEFLALAGTDDPEYDRLRLRIVFSGAGPRMRAVRRFAAEHPSARLEIMGPVSADCLGVHLRSADILLASLELAWTGCLLPSKVQAALAAGRPVLFVGDARSAIATWLRESGGGWVVAPGDLGALKRAVVDAAQPAVRERMGRAAAAFAAQRFDAVAGPLTLCAWIEAAVAGAQRRMGA
jgi:glycosyltransferase involved in cell wall biosynthesis